MAIVKELLVKFNGDAKGLETASEKAKNAVSKVGDLVKKAAIATTVAATAFSALAVQQSRVGDEAGKAAQRLGIATEALLGYHHAARLSDLSAEEFNTTLKFMLKNSIEAAQGNKSVSDALGVLGVKTKDFLSLDTQGKFELIADRLGKIEDAGLRTNIAMTLFGRSGDRVLTMIKDGAAVFAATAAEARRFGIVISDIDAAKLEAANDSMTKLRTISEGAARQFSVGLAPSITSIVEKIAEAPDGMNRFRRAGELVGETLENIYSLLVSIKNVNLSTLFTGKSGSDPFANAKSQYELDEFLLKKYRDGKAPAAKKPSGNTSDEVEAAMKNFESYRKKLEDARQKQIDYNNATADSFIRIKDELMAGGKAADVFRRAALSAINDVINNMIRVGVGGTAQGGGGMFGTIAQSIAGASGGLFSSIGGALSKFLPSFDVGSSYVPRDMTANIHKGEMIIPAKEAAAIRSGGGSGGGVTVVQNISIGAGVQGTVRAEIARMLPDIKRATVAGVEDAKLRGATT